MNLESIRKKSFLVHECISECFDSKLAKKKEEALIYQNIIIMLYSEEKYGFDPINLELSKKPDPAWLNP